MAGLSRALILSDGKPGHRNQAIAVARHLNLDFDTVDVRLRSRTAKGLSYLFDHLCIYYEGLFLLSEPIQREYSVLIAAGSESYYAAKIIGKNHNIQVVAVMLPKGFRYKDFALIIAPEHDSPPSVSNVRTVPVNPSWVEPAGIIKLQPGERLVSLVIGGSNHVYAMDVDALRPVIETMFRQFSSAQIMVATSRRTPREVDTMLQTFPFARRFLYSEDPANPIPDFLALSDYVFLTADSTSMISEAVSFGSACVEVIPLKTHRSPGKFARLTSRLQELGCLHIFDGAIGEARKKINFSDYLHGVRLCG